MTVDTHKETLGFQAEVKQLLDIMIHSLYSNKEIFLRELISNASDAIDRLRFAALSDDTLYEGDTDFKIRVSYDKDARTISVSDNGIGMTRPEVIEQIGTIAKSGTHEFFQSLTGDQQKDASLIGQFGVGFYSSFVVADRVTLTTRHAGYSPAEGVTWESDGRGEYTLETVEKPTRGTEVVLHLREGEDDLLDGNRLRAIIRKYSDHIMLPIVMKSEVKDKENEDEVVNRASALWTRPKSEITEEEYNEFYKHIAHDFNDPLAYVHSRMEGNYDAEKLMPGYLRFVRGVIDSNDLPLNVSREILQQNRIIDTIRSNAVKKVLNLLTDLAANNKEKYATFWKEFGRALKEGLLEDHANHESITRLLRFASTASTSETQDVSLEDYAARMKEGQDKIYYITADSYTAAKDSPLLEIFKKKGIEVLFFSDPVDLLLEPELPEFNGKKLQSVSRGALDLTKLEDEQEKEEQQKSEGEVKDLLVRFKEALGEKVKEVRASSRLTTSPACLVVGEYDIDPNLKRLLQAAGQAIPGDKPILEVNPQHPIIVKLRDEKDEKRITDWAYILFDQSVLSMGEKLDNPVDFVNRLNDLLSQL